MNDCSNRTKIDIAWVRSRVDGIRGYSLPRDDVKDTTPSPEGEKPPGALSVYGYDEEWLRSRADPLVRGIKDISSYVIPTYLVPTGAPLKSRLSDLSAQRSQPEPLNQPAVRQ